MTNKPKHLLPLLSSRLTATVSVALVLLVLGLTAMVGCAGVRVANNVRQSVGFVLVMSPDATGAQISDMKRRLSSQPWVSSVAESTAEQVLARWQQMVGPDEDILKMAGANPFSPELEVRVRPRWANADSLARLSAPLEMAPSVDQVSVQDQMVQSLDSTIAQVTVALGVIAVALLVISIVLIFNTVRLAVYARRFTIYTMKLVGATRGFIRRPFLRANAVNGVAAGLFASGILAAMVQAAHEANFDVSGAVTWTDAWIVMGSLVVAGVLICTLAALAATNKYLSRSYDDMYRK